MYAVQSHWISPARQVLNELTPIWYPFGNTGARNLLEEHDIKPKENNDPLKVLFLGCGDLRNALTTINGRKGSFKLDIHFNDFSPSIIARNILIVTVIDAADFNIENQADLTFLWDIWYNALWSEATSKRFLRVVNDLLNGHWPGNVHIEEGQDQEILNKVWKKWASLVDASTQKKAAMMKEISNARKEYIVDGWKRQTVREGPQRKSREATLREATDGLAFHVETTLYQDLQSMKSATRSKIRQELVYYLEHGYCFLGRQDQRTKNVGVNPTFLDPLNDKWYVHYLLNPFEGFFSMIKHNILKDEEDKKNEHGILVKTCQKLFKEFIAGYKNVRQSVTVTFHMSDALEFCYKSSEVFDVIDCSNLTDNLGLPNILVAARLRLSDHPDSAIIVETMKWRTIAATVELYVQEALAAPLSMIPTIYGLKLVNNVEFGAQNIKMLIQQNPLPRILVWRRCPDYENVVFTPSKTVKLCMDHLFEKCFYDTSSIRLIAYTPLTFYTTAHSLMQRFGKSPATGNSPSDVITAKVPPAFRMQYRAMDDWAKGKRLWKFTSNKNQEMYPMGFASLDTNKNQFPGTPILRLVLVPMTFDPSGFLSTRDWILPTNTEAHLIDNFSFVLNRKKDKPNEFESFHLSFFLPEDNGIEATYQGFVYDMMLKLPLYSIGSIKYLLRERFTLPYPITFSPEQSPASSSDNRVPLKMIQCLEAEENYVIEIEATSTNAEDVKLSTDRETPCEAANLLSLSLKESPDLKPLWFFLPHAFIADAVRLSKDTERRSLRVLLPKATKEPWSFHFRRSMAAKTDPERLNTWKEEEGNDMGMSVHIALQFRIDEMENESLMRKTPLNEIRKSIREIFFHYFNNGREYFSLNAGWTKRSSDWYLKLHPPLKVGPNGEPLVMVSAVDHILAEKLQKNGKLKLEESLSDFTRVFSGFTEIIGVVMETPEEAELFRYLLRLNSTKVLPNVWQKENLPKKKNTPWLATFLSPLYRDATSVTKNDKLDKMFGTHSNSKLFDKLKAASDKSCASCLKSDDNLRRCSRCKQVSYCGIECQKAHWPCHKPDCKSS